MAAAFVSAENGFNDYSVTVPSGTDRLLVVIAYSASARTGSTATYGGVSMTVASNSNDWVHIYYMFDPPVGAATLSITHGDLQESVALHYTGLDSFQSASTGTTASASFSPSGAGAVVFGLSAASSGHTPATSCNERYDNTNEWACDRFVAGSGAVTVGASSATTPDFAGAIFLEPAGSYSFDPSTLTLPELTLSGSLTPVLAVSGALQLPELTLSGSLVPVFSVAGSLTLPELTLAGSLAPTLALSGALVLPELTLSGALVTVVSLSGAPVLPLWTLSGALAPVVTLDGALTLPEWTLGGSLSPELALSGALELPQLELAGSFAPEDGTFDLQPADLVLPELALSGAVEPVTIVSGDLTLPALALSGSFTPVLSLSGALELPELELSGSLTTEPLDVTISGALQLPELTLSGAFTIDVTVSGSLSLPGLLLSGSFTPFVPGYNWEPVTLVLPELTLSGSFIVVPGFDGIPGLSTGTSARLSPQYVSARRPLQPSSAALPFHAIGARLPKQRIGSS